MHIVKQNGRRWQIGPGLLGEDGRAPSMPGWRAGEWPGNKNEHGAKPHTPLLPYGERGKMAGTVSRKWQGIPADMGARPHTPYNKAQKERCKRAALFRGQKLGCISERQGQKVNMGASPHTPLLGRDKKDSTGRRVLRQAQDEKAFI